MRGTGAFKSIIPIISCLLLLVEFCQGAEADESDKPIKGTVRFRYDNYFVDGDAGRFREDNWRNDDSSGGLDWLHVESTRPDERGYDWLIEAKALYDYNYDFLLLANKQESHYLKLDFSGLRRYYDGSNEYWNEALYSLPGADARGTSDHDDDDIFVDRYNYNIELGLTPPEGIEAIFGWHRMERDGKETLLRGSRARITGDPVPKFRGIPAISHVSGVTDTFYGELANTFADKYNVRVRQEFEQYNDSQKIFFPRFLDGALEEDRRFIDDPGYTNSRTMLMFDSFLDEHNYVTANYMYNYMNNDTERQALSPGLTDGGGNPIEQRFIGNDVGNSRRTNVGSFGYRKANLMPNLYMSLGARLEDSRTSSSGTGFSNNDGATSMDPATNLRTAISKMDEVRTSETVRLVYDGIKKTTLSFDADLEQRHIDWSESEDIRSHEIFNNPAVQFGGTQAGVGGFLNRKADIDHQNQIYTVKGVHRHNRAVRSTIKYKIKDLDRTYSERFDNDLLYYPGIIGDYRRKGNEVTAKTDLRLNPSTSTTLMYQYVQESIHTDVGSKTQNLEIHRGSGSVALNPTSNLFMVFSFMLENYELNTPGVGLTGAVAGSSKPFDYVGNSFSILLDGTYAFNSRTSVLFGYRHTEALGEGDGDNVNDNAYDSVGVTLNRKISENQKVGLGYQFINFNNHNGGSFDDYEAHGLLVTYSFTF